MMTNQARQAAYRARQREQGRTSVTLLMTKDEAFFVERLLRQMRLSKSVPAMMRRPNGTLEAFDA